MFRICTPKAIQHDLYGPHNSDVSWRPPLGQLKLQTRFLFQTKNGFSGSSVGKLSLYSQTHARICIYIYTLYTYIIYIYIYTVYIYIYMRACVWARFIYNLMIISELLSITISFYFKRWIHDAGVCLEDEASTQWQVEVVEVEWQMEGQWAPQNSTGNLT